MKLVGRKLFLLPLAYLAMGVQGCPNSHKSPPVAPPTVSEKIFKLIDDPEMIDFKAIQANIIQPHCIECHSNKVQRADVNLENYDDNFGRTGFKKVLTSFEPDRSSFYQTLILPPTTSRHMPPSNRKQLSPEQIELVRVWITAGAKEIVNQVVEREPTLSEQLSEYFARPETIDHAVINQFILKPHCNSCHSTNSPDWQNEALEYGMDTTDYSALFDPFVPGVEVGSHLDSRMYKSIVINQSMPPVEEGYELLDPELNRLLRLWIINCAIEDYASLGEEELLPQGNDKVRLCEGQ